MKKLVYILTFICLAACSSTDEYEDRTRYCYSDHWGKWDGYTGQAKAEDLKTGEICLYTATLDVTGATNWDHVSVKLRPHVNSVFDYCLYFIGNTFTRSTCGETSLYGTNETDTFYVTMSVVKNDRDKTAVVNYFEKDDEGNPTLVGIINFEYTYEK